MRFLLSVEAEKRRHTVVWQGFEAMTVTKIAFQNRFVLINNKSYLIGEGHKEFLPAKDNKPKKAVLGRLSGVLSLPTGQPRPNFTIIYKSENSAFLI